MRSVRKNTKNNLYKVLKDWENNQDLIPFCKANTNQTKDHPIIKDIIDQNIVTTEYTTFDKQYIYIAVIHYHNKKDLGTHNNKNQ